MVGKQSCFWQRHCSKVRREGGKLLSEAPSGNHFTKLDLRIELQQGSILQSGHLKQRDWDNENILCFVKFFWLLQYLSIILVCISLMTNEINTFPLHVLHLTFSWFKPTSPTFLLSCMNSLCILHSLSVSADLLLYLVTFCALVYQ